MLSYPPSGVEPVEKPLKGHILGPSRQRRNFTDANKNSGGDYSEPEWRTFHHLVNVERHHRSLIALNEAWCVCVLKGTYSTDSLST